MKGKWLRKPQSDCSVVFVHGLLSDSESCWTNANGIYWPQLLTETSSLAPVGIYVFEYLTNIFSGTYRLGDVVDALKEHLRLDLVDDSRQIIFVCHSMGGIAVRKFLVERATDLIDRKIEIGLFLIASPSLGSSYATWLNPLARFLHHAQGDALAFARDNAWLSDLDKEFQNLKESGKLVIRGKELVEDKFVVLQSFLRRQVVEPFSGARYFGEPYKVPGSDHFSIAKPMDSEAIQHRLLGRFIEEMIVPLKARGDVTETLSGSSSEAESNTVPEQPGEMRNAEYDRWYTELNNGRVEVHINPADAVETNILDRIVNNVLKEKQFSQTVAGNAHVVLLELLANVAKHVENSEAAVTVELNTRHLPVILITVGDTGKGYDLWENVSQEYLQMKTGGREHGLGRICRLSDQVLPPISSDTGSFFKICCIFYDIDWPGSPGDPYAWCEKVILDYTGVPCVWFGRRRYPLWWHYREHQIWMKEWAILGALDFAIDHEIPQLMNNYVGHVAPSTLPYLFFEIRGHGATEPAEPRSSEETIEQTLEKCFMPHFTSKTVLLYASRDAYTRKLIELSQKYELPLYLSEKECLAALKGIDKRRRRASND